MELKAFPTPQKKTNTQHNDVAIYSYITLDKDEMSVLRLLL